MFDVKQTKRLSEAFYKLHSLNLKHKATTLEREIFIVDKIQNTEKRLTVEEDIRKVLVEIDKLWEGELK